MSKVTKLTIILSTLLLQACATQYARQSACMTQDWYASGFDVAKHGRNQEAGWDQVSAKCRKENMWVDRGAYDQGYKLGLDTFCTELNGFEFGQRNRSYDPICSTRVQNLFDVAYAEGQQLYDAYNDIGYCERAISDLHNKIAYIEQRREELAYYIDHTEIDQKTEKRYVKERYRLKQSLYSTQSKLDSAQYDLRESIRRHTTLEKELFAQHYLDELDQGDGYSINESVVSENIIVNEPAVIVYKPIKQLSRATKKHFKSVTKELNNFIAVNDGGQFRYQIVGDLELEFSSAQKDSLVVSTRAEYKQPTLLLWDGKKSLKTYPYQDRAPAELLAILEEFIRQH